MKYDGGKRYFEFRIDYPKTPAGRKSWNRRFGTNAYYVGKHWSARQRDAEYWHTLTRAAVREAGLSEPMFTAPVEITAYFNDALDCSNHSVIFKMIEDGLRGLLITDDSRRYVCGVSMRFHDFDYIRVIVRET